MTYVGVFLAFFTTAALLLMTSELGLHLGRRRKGDIDPEARAQISMVEGALLGLLGLLLGFTFSMAVGRFDVRQELVVKEANSLGTVYLLCDFLPPAAQPEARAKVRQYADLRLELAKEGTSE